MTQPFFDVRMKGFRDRVDVADVLRLLDDRTQCLAEELVPLPELAGRILSRAIVAQVNVPGFARAAMDGYAVLAENTFGADTDNPLSLRIIGESLPALPFPGTVQTGEAVRIMTGAPIPNGADAVIQAEATEEEPGTGRVLVRESVSPGRHIGRIGEDVTQGCEVLPIHRKLRPQDVGLLTSIGIGAANVIRRPRVAILVTGNELLRPGAMPYGYQIVDSNSPMLSALVNRDGAECLPVQYLEDRYETIRDALATVEADMVLVSGGSSVGKEDYAPRAVAELGVLSIHGIALRPASPTGVGFLPASTRLRARTIFLLPGNPVSCLCAYDLFAGRVIRQLGGRNSAMPYRCQSFPLATKIVSAVGRVDYARVKQVGDAVEPIAVSGASILSTTVSSVGFVLVDRDREGYAPGERVNVWLYD